MGLSKDELSAKFETEKVLEQLKVMQKITDYRLIALTEQALLNAELDRIPWLSGFIERTTASGDAISKIGQRISSLVSPSSSSIGQGFHFGSVAMAAADFARIPIIYLAAYILGQKVPITLDNNARWLYSGVLLALTITALAVPASAPIIALVGAGISLSTGAFLLSKTLYERYQLGKEFKKLKTEIAGAESEMLLTQQKAKVLEQQLTAATQEDQIIGIYQQISILQEDYESQKRQLQELKTKELHVEQKIDEIGVTAVMDKVMGICLPAASIVGLAVSLFVPPVGLGILTGVAIVGGVYLGARLSTPLIQSLGSWLINKFKTVSGMEATGERASNENSLTNSDEKQKNSANGLNDKPASTYASTAKIFLGLMKKEEAIELLQINSSHNDEEELNHTNTHFNNPESPLLSKERLKERQDNKEIQPEDQSSQPN